MKIVLDSDVLIHHFRPATSPEKLDRLTSRTRCYLSSVVAMELRAGCTTKSETRSLERFFEPFEKSGRVIYPNHSMWLRAGVLLADLRRHTRIESTKRRTLANDALIAVSAASIGAAVVTMNAADFRLLAKSLPFAWFDGLEGAFSALD